MATEKPVASSEGATRGSRFAAFYRDATLVTCNVVVLLAFVELGAAGLLRWGHLCDAPVPDSAAVTTTQTPQERIPYYVAQPWGQAFWREHRKAEAIGRYAPYVLWKTAPFQGQYVNISAQHVRRTPGPECVAGARRIFVLGGSAVWGWGSPDSGTVPAHLWRELARRGSGPVCVTNLGQNAYVTTQELIELVTRLQHGETPDLVVFYDGFNDAYAAFETRRPGVHYMVDQVAAKLERREGSVRHALGDLVRATYLYRALRCAGSKPPTPTGTPVLDDSTRKLAGEVLAEYDQVYRIVESLSRTYGFEFEFFWQPSLYAGHKTLSPDEQRLHPQDRRAPPLVAEIYRGAEASALVHPKQHYLGNVFDGDTSQIYIDYVHVTPAGNAIVARAIADVLVPAAEVRH